MSSGRIRLRARLTRDSVLFVAGLAGIAYETLGRSAERPTLIVAFLAMMGLPVFLRRDEAQNEKVQEAAKERGDGVAP